MILQSQRDTTSSLYKRVVEYESKMEENKMKCKEQKTKCKEHESKMKEFEKKSNDLEANVWKTSGMMWKAWVACSIFVVILLGIMWTYRGSRNKYLGLPHWGAVVCFGFLGLGSGTNRWFLFVRRICNPTWYFELNIVIKMVLICNMWRQFKVFQCIMFVTSYIRRQFVTKFNVLLLWYPGSIMSVVHEH